MLKSISFLILLLSNICKGQNIKVYEVQQGQGKSMIVADNNEVVPYSIKLKLILSNAKSDKGTTFNMIIPPHTKNVFITNITTGKGRYSVGIDYTFEKGNAINPSHDNYHVYLLPFPTGQKYRLTQGYNGSSTHKTKKALDFEMPVGSKVCAARYGKVLKVKENSNSGCASSKCLSHANYIEILHDDGSVANYSHLQYNGALVKEGDIVKAGDIIGFSGNTGYSNKPHLHFEVYVKSGNSIQTVETTFDINGVPTIIGNQKIGEFPVYTKSTPKLVLEKLR